MDYNCMYNGAKDFLRRQQEGNNVSGCQGVREEEMGIRPCKRKDD